MRCKAMLGLRSAEPRSAKAKQSLAEIRIGKVEPGSAKAMCCGSGYEQPGQAKATQGVAPMSRDANEMHGAELRRQSIALLGAGGG